MPRQCVQRLKRIRHAEEWAGAFETLFHDGGGSALIDGSFGEPMPIHAFALDRKEEIAALQRAAVNGDTAHRNGRGARWSGFQRRRDF